MAREAAFLARQRGVRFVDREDVDRALLAGYVKGTRQVDAGMVRW